MSKMKRLAEQADWPKPTPTLADFRADGRTYDARQDQRRLGHQAQLVWDFMAGVPPWHIMPGREAWHTLNAISLALGIPEASISARLRDFRKPRFGSHTVERRRRKDSHGTWEYRLIVNDGGDL